MSADIGASLWLTQSVSARALMAGVPPDDPSLRIDPNTAESAWAGVCSIVRATGGIYTGTLIRRNLVLTAAHVVGGIEADGLTCRFNAGAASAAIKGRRTFVHPRYKGFIQPFTHCDIAVIELERPAPIGVPVYTSFTGSLRPGTVITMVGYGGSGYGNLGPSIGARDDVKRTGRNQLDAIVPDPERPGTPGLFLYDFDGRSSTSNRLGGPTLGNADETTAAKGDSGAPAFLARGNYRVLVGVLTFVAHADQGPASTPSTFGTTGGGVLLSAVADWLEPLIRG